MSAARLWAFSLDVAPARLTELACSLTADETARAARFRFPRDRHHFVAARGTLRAILGGETGVRPAALRFRYGERGKPSLDATATGESLPDIRFNLSHSNGLALCAVTLGREVGVDIECTRSGLADLRTAHHFFSPRELASLQSLPPEEQSMAFYRCWTRKEAFIKATGEGVARPLASFDVSLAPHEPAALLATRGDPAEAERWELTAPEVGDIPGLDSEWARPADYLAALCVRVSRPPVPRA